MTSSISSSKLFEPIQVGDVTLKHRVVLAPLTRLRANAQKVHGSLGLEYYKQRSSVPGTLLISEGVMVEPLADHLGYIPGITTEVQINAWKEIAEAVHANGSYIYMQICGIGRAANPAALAGSGFEVVGPSPISITGKNAIPHELTEEEIKEYVTFFRDVAVNAVHRAGFDGVEIHGANGYLVDQFWQDNSNVRVDQYGGSIENRVRFSLEILEAVTNAIGQEKTAIRMSPWSTFQDMRMKEPKPTFAHLVSRIRDLYPNFSYLHVVEPRISADDDDAKTHHDSDSNDFLREIWLPRPFISAGGYDAQSAAQISDKTGELVAFGRLFISNPDLPSRLKSSLPLTKADRSTFYSVESPVGYIDYPFASTV